ncbi:hypothetical protein Tco_0223869 [Tanacetum coccineum]
MPPKRNGMSAAAIEQPIKQRVTEALAAQENNRNNGNPHNSDSYSTGGGERTTRHCTYKDFLNCQLLNFKGTERVIGLVHYALTWWNSHVRTVGHDAAYGMPWKTLKKMMTEAYYPRSKIKKLETELWNLTVKEWFPDESDKVEKYVRGLPDNIQGNVMSARPKMLQKAIELATSLMDQKVHNYAARQADNKRRMDNNPRENNVQQPPYKRQDVARAYTVGLSEKKEYAGTLPLCNKCKLHHNGPCTVKCANYKKVGHMTRDCRSLIAAADQRTLTFFECGNQGHYRSECPRLKNQNCGNQTGNGEARGKVYALGEGETDQDPNNITNNIDARREIFLVLPSET